MATQTAEFLEKVLDEGEQKWGTWVNPQIQRLTRNRIILERQASRSKDLRDIILEVCKEDPVRWINDWVWTADPRNLDYGKPVNVPFLLFPVQEEYIRWRRERRSRMEPGLVEKSRDMGATWLNIADHVHSWLFERGYKGVLASRKELLVDRIGDLDALFPKVRFIIDALPEWMRPSAWEDNYMRIINRDTGASLTGEAGDNIGRGGRASVVDVDEFAFLERPMLVEAALSQTTKVVFYTSTPNGTGNPFYQKRHGGKIQVFTFHWRRDPRKDDFWYQKMCEQLDPIIVAQEINIDYHASMKDVMIPAAWVQAAIDLFTQENVQFGNRQAGLDVATEGKNRNVLTLVQGPLVFGIYEWQGMNTTETAYEAVRLMRENFVKHLNFDVDGVGAGVAGTLKTSQNLGVSFTPLHGSSSPSDLFWQAENRPSKDKFLNLRAEAWWLMRERFKKTYETIKGIREYEPEELISIPNHPGLITQISTPKMQFSTNGKIKVESKDDMAKRGVQSPDYADSLAYSLYFPALPSDRYHETTASWGGSSKKATEKQILHSLMAKSKTAFR